MKFLFQILRVICIAAILTAITQVGGLIYLAYKPVGIAIQRRLNGPITYLRYLALIAFYILLTQLITPTLAERFGRSALPLSNSKLKPANRFIWLANRHYVKPELFHLLEDVSETLPPNVSLVYLDANFPFFDGFPLIGHLSHNDGEKVDLAFIYSDAAGNFLNDVKSLSGYGILEKPKPTELDQPNVCQEQGHWQYNLVAKFALMERFKEYEFDHSANKLLLETLASDSRTGKIFIEPHLRDRLGLNLFSKVRYHGCHAVRHDDQIHLEL